MNALLERSLLLALLLASLAHASPIHVRQGALGANDGSSWGSAFTDLQLALAAAGAGDSIWVAAGTYHPSTADPDSSFLVPDAVVLLGGFSGSESLAGQRNPHLHHCILDGDLNQDDGQYVIAPNSKTVVSLLNCGSATVLDGFTVQRGYSIVMVGNGLHIDGGAPQIRNCRMQYNSATWSGGCGARVLNADPIFEKCEFAYNTSYRGHGGAVNLQSSGAHFQDCHFLYNTTVGGAYYSADGGAVYASSNSQIDFDNCHFRNNEARNPFTLGGTYRSGGALYCSGTGPVDINRCVFDNNRAHVGGAIFSYAELQIDNSLFTHNFVESHSVQEWLSAGDYGGAVSTFSYSPAHSVVRNSTFSGNTAGEGGGIAALGEHPVDVYNSIFQDNIATGTETKPMDPSFTGSGDLFYSNVEGIFTQEAGEDPPDSTNFPGCMDEDPLFINAGLYDFRPGAGSACIDAGDNDFILAFSQDLSGGSRLLDDPLTPDTGNGPAPITDMGAYEFSNPLPAPAAPILEISLFAGTIQLNWTASSGAQMYHIYGYGNGGVQSLLGTSSLTAWTMPQALYDSASTWTFVVRAE